MVSLNNNLAEHVTCTKIVIIPEGTKYGCFMTFIFYLLLYTIIFSSIQVLKALAYVMVDRVHTGSCSA